jgi:pimeloyl-ACP methyl ester carboxylesterase
MSFSSSPAERRIAVPGGTLFALDWEGSGPTLVFSHATGMCATLYRDLLAPLADRFRIIAFDARGHGRTDLPADPAHIPTDWRLYQADLVALVEAIGGAPVLLAGHSFGATVAFEAAVANPGLARGVLLLDPAFIPFAHAAGYAAARQAGQHPPNIMADKAAKRRPHFASLADARAAWTGRGVFADWPASALEAYLEGGLRHDPTGVHLACRPAWEATSFRGVSTTLEASVRACSLPFILLAGGEGSTVSGEDFEAIRALHPDAPAERFPETGHFFPVTHAGLVRPWFDRLAEIAA